MRRKAISFILCVVMLMETMTQSVAATVSGSAGSWEKSAGSSEETTETSGEALSSGSSEKSAGSSEEMTETSGEALSSGSWEKSAGESEELTDLSNPNAKQSAEQFSDQNAKQSAEQDAEQNPDQNTEQDTVGRLREEHSFKMTVKNSLGQEVEAAEYNEDVSVVLYDFSPAVSESWGVDSYLKMTSASGDDYMSKARSIGEVIIDKDNNQITFTKVTFGPEEPQYDTYGVEPGEYKVAALIFEDKDHAPYLSTEYSCEQTFTVTRSDGAPVIITRKLPDMVEGEYYSAKLQADGDAPLTWTNAKGNWDLSWTGLTLSADGTISGTVTIDPTDEIWNGNVPPQMTLSINFKVTDKDSKAVTRVIDSVLYSAASATPRISTTYLYPGRTGRPYSGQVIAEGGGGFKSISATGLPEGLSMSNDGLITGTPTQVGDFTVSINAVPQNTDYDPVSKTLPLKIKGDILKVNISADIIAKALDSTCLLYGTFADDESICFATVTPKTLKGEDYLKEIGYSYGSAKVRDIQLRMNISNSDEQVILASTPEGTEYDIEGSQTAVLSLNPALPEFIRLPNELSFEDSDGKKLDFDRDYYDLSFRSKDKGGMFAGAVTTADIGDCQLNLQTRHALVAANPFLDFENWYIKGSSGDKKRIYNPHMGKNVTLVIPVFKKSQKLTGHVFYALSDDTPAPGQFIEIIQRLPETTQIQTAVTGKDGSFSVDIYPGIDATLQPSSLYRSVYIAAGDLEKAQTIYLPADRTSANLNLTIKSVGENDEDTQRYLKVIGDRSIIVNAFLGDKQLTNGCFGASRSGTTHVLGIWNMAAYDELIALSKKPSDRSITLTWDDSSFIPAGTKQITGLDSRLCGDAVVEMPVRGGVVLTAKNESTISASYKALWFDHATGKLAGESPSVSIYGKYTTDIAYPCPAKAGTFDVVILSDKLEPGFDSYKDFKEKYSEDSTTCCFENVTVADKKGTYLGEKAFDEAKLTGAVYLTQPSSSISSFEGSYKTEDCITFTGSVILDKGYTGKINRIYAVNKGGGELDCLYINGSRHNADKESNYFNFKFSPAISAPASFTAYVNPEMGKDVDMYLYADIQADTKEGQSREYRAEPIGRIYAQKPGISFTVPQVAGKKEVHAWLSVPEKTHVSIYDSDNLIYEEDFEKKFNGTIVIKLAGCDRYNKSTHELTAKARTKTGDNKFSESSVSVKLPYKEGFPTVRRQYMELVREDGTAYGVVENGESYNNTWLVNVRLCVEFDNYENLDDNYAKTILGEAAPAVAATQMHSGWNAGCFYPLKGKDGVYRSEIIYGRSIENVDILFGAKEDGVNYQSEIIDVSRAVNEAKTDKVKGTALEKLVNDGSVEEAKADAASVYHVELQKTDYQNSRSSIKENLQSVKPDAAKAEQMSNALKDKGLYYIDPASGKIDKDKGPQWTHVDGKGDFVSAVEMMDKAKDANIPNGSYAYTDMSRKLTEEEFYKELKKMTEYMPTIAEYDAPYYDPYHYNGDFDTLDITYYDDYMPVNSIVVTDETGAVMEETYTVCFPGETSVGEVTVNRVAAVDESGTPTGGYEYSETGNMMVTGPSDRTGDPSDPGSVPPDPGSFTGEGGGFGFLDPNGGGGEGGGMDSFTAYGEYRNIKGLYDGVNDLRDAMRNSGGSGGYGWAGIDGQLLSGSIDTLMNIYDFASDTMTLMDVKLQAKKLLNSPCADKLPRQTYENMKRNYDQFVNLVNDAEAWSTSLAVLNSIHTGAQTFGAYNAGGAFGKALELTISGGLYGANHIKQMKMQNVADESKLFIDMLKLFIWKTARANNDFNCLQALMKDRKNTEKANYKPYIDPSGTVYEGVLSKPVEGAQVRLYVRDEGAEDGLAPADPEALDPSTNVLTTNAAGYYSWLVNEGEYFVTAQSDAGEGDSGEDVMATVKGGKHDYLPVPPPQLDVNIPIMDYTAPTVSYIKADPQGVYLVFDKYMDEDSLKAEDAFVVRDKYGNILVTSTELLDSETEPDNIRKDARGTYSSAVCLKGNFKMGNTLFISVDEGVLSYCGVGMGETKPFEITVADRSKAPEPTLTSDSAKPGVITDKLCLFFEEVEDGRIWYTVDGSDPKTSDTAKIYRGGLTLMGDMTVKAYTQKFGFEDSDVKTFEFESPDNLSQHQGNTDWAFEQEEKERQARKEKKEVKPAPMETEKTYVYQGTLHTYTIKYGTNMEYTGKKQKPPVTVTLEDGTQLTKKEFSVRYKNNKNAGEAQIYVKLKKAYKADKKPLDKTALAFTIRPLTVTQESVTYKKIKKGKVSSLKVGKLKVKKKEYVFDEAALTITFSGNFTGSVKVPETAVTH